MNAELLAAIESPKTAALVNVVSGYNQFVRALASLPEVQNLLEQVQSQDDTVELLLRVLDLVRAPYDPAYESPHDVALAAYLWVLRMTDAEVASVAADVVRECPGCWWAGKLAERLLAARKARAESHSVTKVVSQQALVRTRTRHSADSPKHGRSSALDVILRGEKPSRRNRGAGNRINRQSFEAAA